MLHDGLPLRAHQLSICVSERQALKGTGEHDAPKFGFSIFSDLLLYRRDHLVLVGHREPDNHLETPPDCGIEKLRVIGGRKEQPGGRPLVDFLEKDCNEPFELAYFYSVVSAFRDGVEFIEEKDAFDAFCIVKN